MNGRGRGQSGGQSGRGRGRRNFKRSNTQKSSVISTGTKKERKSVSDYVYYIGSAKQARNFSVITSYLINHIRKTFNNGDDIGNAIESKTPMDHNTIKPSMVEVTTTVAATDAAERKTQQAKYDKEY